MVIEDKILESKIINNKEDLSKLKVIEPNLAIENKIQTNWDKVAKPINGLGKFERIIAKIGAIQGSDKVNIDNKAIIVMCADNGIVEEGVSQSGQEVTSIVTSFMGRNQSSVGKMAAVNGVDIIPIDIGINSDEIFEGVLNYKISKGTRNFLKEPAMTEDEVIAAINIGINCVKECKIKGYAIIGTGEMGIGNTTTSSAVVAAVGEFPIDLVTGRGAGLSDEGLKRKYEVIENSINKYKLSSLDPFETLRCVGGLDIAGLVGVCIGGALYNVPIVLDGLIALAAGLTAEALVPGVKDYLLASHMGKEPAIGMICDKLTLSPIVMADMALGEGTGVVMLMGLLDIAMAVYSSDTTFDEMKIEQYERFES